MDIQNTVDRAADDHRGERARKVVLSGRWGTDATGRLRLVWQPVDRRRDDEAAALPDAA